MANCGSEDAECAFTCGMLGLDNQPFLDVTQCMADLDCLPAYPDDGACLAGPEDAIQGLTDIAQVISREIWRANLMLGGIKAHRTHL